MLPSYCVFIALATQIAVFLYLKPWEQFAITVKYLRLMRTVNAYRYAGLFLVLIAVPLAHAQYEVFEDQAKCPGCVGIMGGKPKSDKESHEIVRRYEKAKQHIFLDIPHMTNPNQWMWMDESGKCSGMGCINTAIALGNGKYEVTWYDAMMFSFTVFSFTAPHTQEAAPVYSDGDDAIAKRQLQYLEQQGGITGYEPVDRVLLWTWGHLGRLLVLAIIGFLLVQFGHGGESNDTNVDDMLDPEYRTGFVTDYHGDDAFETPDGMESAHRAVPVRKVHA